MVNLLSSRLDEQNHNNCVSNITYSLPSKQRNSNLEKILSSVQWMIFNNNNNPPQMILRGWVCLWCAEKGPHLMMMAVFVCSSLASLYSLPSIAIRMDINIPLGRWSTTYLQSDERGCNGNYVSVISPKKTHKLNGWLGIERQIPCLLANLLENIQ